jgi:hypothetical protein
MHPHAHTHTHTQTAQRDSFRKKKKKMKNSFEKQSFIVRQKWTVVLGTQVYDTHDLTLFPLYQHSRKICTDYFYFKYTTTTKVLYNAFTPLTFVQFTDTAKVPYLQFTNQ